MAPNAVSIAQAYFEPCARFKAICAGIDPVGFVMWRPRAAPEIASLWRFMIDHRHQGKGYGKAALMLLCRDLSASGFRCLETSVVLGLASPLEFYRALGFRETGETLPSGEFGLSLDLSPLGQ
ncbi:GNAT family N-acetyltransferase [Bosea vaviloviae]|uniref:GNAT family N-acetyltransferase n=1 Tax=Bosea vaviloviae TaxID=1526658 RepID=UPI0018D0E07E|nr:GNAT family N-acetyltransferase [Bosea vaviloviae]